MNPFLRIALTMVCLLAVLSEEGEWNEARFALVRNLEQLYNPLVHILCGMC